MFDAVLNKLSYLNLKIISVIFLIVTIGLLVLYSASGGKFSMWALPHLYRFLFGFFCLLLITLTSFRYFLDGAYFFYLLSFFLLLFVEIFGFIGMGAQRWINLYFINLQPSELMKISLILALARFYALSSFADRNSMKNILTPLILIGLPVLLVLKQPDLGTAVVLSLTGLGMMLMNGVSWWFFGSIITAVIAALPLIWNFGLHAYQKNRILIFLNPERDPLGTGYHITQSKIALGSGGFWGKGFMNGTQASLNFLPEKQTDFIFTMFCEEFGFFGGVFLIALYMILIFYGWRLGFLFKNRFHKFTVQGISLTLFLYLFINIAMVTGLIPVVGVPLPLLSYGGTAMLTFLTAYGIIFSAYIDEQRKFQRDFK